MKKISILSLFTAIIISLLGCSLNMEEYVVPEERQGFDEAIVEESEIGTVKFQYQDNVQVLTKRVQEYIADVRDDSIIYFMDNLPDEWVPRVGHCLFGKITPILPYGMSAKVLEVTHLNGYYKVVTTMASDQEVFKQKVIDIDCDYVLQNIENKDKEGSDLTTLNDSVIADWSYNDGDIPDYASDEEYSKDATRAEPQDSTIRRSYKYSAKTTIPLGERAGLTAKGTLEVVVKKKLHFYEELGKKRENWEIDESYEQVTLEVGVEGGAVTPKDKESWGEFLSKNNLEGFAKRCLTNKSDAVNGASLYLGTKLPTIHIPLGGVCYFDITIEGGITITPSAVGKIVFVHNHRQKKEGEVIYLNDDGEELHTDFKDDRIIKEEGFEVTNFECVGDVSVSIGLSLSLEIGVGLGSGKFGIGLAINLSLTYTAGARLGLGADWHTGQNLQFLPIVDVYHELVFGISVSCNLSVLKKKISLTLWEMEPARLFSHTIHITPKLSSSSKAIYADYLDIDGNIAPCVEATLVLSQMFKSNIYASSFVTDYMRARVYVDDPASGKYLDVYPTFSTSTYPEADEIVKLKPEKDKKYKFVVPVSRIREMYGAYKKLTIVPVFWSAGSPKETELAEEKVTLSTSKPTMGKVLLEHTYAGPSKKGSTNPYLYKFTTLVQISNTADVVSMGYKILITNLDYDITYYEKDIYLKKNTSVFSGYYRTTFSFTTDYGDVDSTGKRNPGLRLQVIPFYITSAGKKVVEDMKFGYTLLRYPVEEHEPAWGNSYSDYDSYVNL